MKKLVLEERAGQVGARDIGQPAPGAAVYIGIDVARSKWVYNVRWGGRSQRKLTTPGELRHLQSLVGEYSQCRVHVVYEACGFGYEIAWWCLESGVDVLVIAPSTVEQPPGYRVKTDRLDAAKMARDREQGRLKGVRIPTRVQHEHRQLSRTYAQAVKDKSRAQIRIRSLLQEQGRIGPAPSAGWKVYLRWYEQQEIPELVARCVQELLSAREVAVASAKRLQRTLLKMGGEEPYGAVVKALEAQGGVGEFTAIRVVLELGDIRRFRTAGSFPRYLGLTPSEYSTGETERRGHVTKCGPRFIRAWLIQCAWASVRPGRDARLRAVFERLVPKIGKKRAIVAVARRLALRLRARWLAVLDTEEVAAA